MSNNYKYLTIDPLILETLNINENRMNHIFDILHGRQKNSLRLKDDIEKGNKSTLIYRK